jgi:hypothetical protein
MTVNELIERLRAVSGANPHRTIYIYSADNDADYSILPAYVYVSTVDNSVVISFTKNEAED